MSIGTLIRNLRKSHSLSQIALSKRAGVSQPALSQIENGERVPSWDTVDKILRSTGSTFVVIPSRREDVSAIAARIAAAEDRGDKARAARNFIQLSDNLAAEHDEIRFALTIAEPAPTGVKHWDAAVAALVIHHLGAEALPIPAWARNPKRRLKRAWTFTSGAYTVPVDRSRVPAAFLDANVLIDQDTLVSV